MSTKNVSVQSPPSVMLSHFVFIADLVFLSVWTTRYASLPISILTCVKSFVPSIVYSLLSTSLHSLESSAASAAEDSHDSEAHVEQCQWVGNESSHFSHPAHAAEHART
jgi:hypothetical protein